VKDKNEAAVEAAVRHGRDFMEDLRKKWKVLHSQMIAKNVMRS
jgi:hypothetical protein